MTGERLALKLLVVSPPHSNARYARACMSQRSECMCEGLSGIFGQIGRASAALVLDNATEAGRMSRGEVTESRPFSLFRAHYRCASRYCNPYSGNEKGSVENAVGYIRRNLLVPVPSVGTLEELNGMLEAGCARSNAASPCRDGRPAAEALAGDLAAMAALPARLRAFGESAIRRDMPAGLVEAVDRMDPAGRRQTLRSISRAAEISGFEAACGAALRVVEGGRVPDDATVDVLARWIAAGGAEAMGGADLDVCDGFPKGGARHAGWRRAHAQGGRCGQALLAHHLGAQGMGAPGHAQAGRVPGGLPRGRARQPRCLQARTASQALRAPGAQGLRRLRLVGDVVARRARARGPPVALVPRAPGGPRAHGRHRHGQDSHGERPVPTGLRQ